MTAKAYSQVNVLGDYLEKPSGFGGWMKTIFQTQEVKLQLALPTRCFLRLKMFCEDLQEYNNSNNNLELSFDELVELLLEDIVEFYAKTNNPLQLNKHFKNLEKLPLAVSSFTQRNEKFIVRLDRKLIFKLEMLLADIAEFEEDHSHSVEKILTLCLFNFLAEIFRGNGEAMRKSIIKRIK